MSCEKYPKPDPSRDQHFVTDIRILEKMVSLARVGPEDVVLEIGAGAGTLTECLSKRGASVIAVESDRRFEESLRKLKHENLKVIYGNALEVMKDIEFSKVVSNIPYSICEPLLNILFRKKFEIAVLSVPEKFYRRISSRPGKGGYSLLAMKTQSFFNVKFGFRVPRKCFHPEPGTESVVITLEPLPREDYEKHPEKYIMREMFLQRKKKLKNALMEALINLNRDIFDREFTKNMARDMIREMRIGSRILEKRAGESGLEDFRKLEEKIQTFLMKASDSC